MPDPFDAIQQRIAAELNNIGQEIVAERQSALSTAAPPSSRPGETPHRRSGNLRARMKAEVRIPDRDRAQLRISNDAAYAKRLQEGMDRPILSPVKTKWLPTVIERLRRAAHGA